MRTNLEGLKMKKNSTYDLEERAGSSGAHK